MNYSKYRFTLDIHKTKSQVSIPIMFKDTNVQFYISMNDGGTPYKITEGCYAKIVGKQPNGNLFYHDCEIEDNRIVYTFNEDTAGELGVTLCEVRLYSPNGSVLTSPRFCMVVEERVISDEEIGDYIEPDDIAPSDMNYSKYRFTLDIHKTKSQVSIPIMLKDTNVRFYMSINDGGSPYQITEGCTAKFSGKKPNGQIIFHDCEIEDNRIVYTFRRNTADVKGITNCEVRIYGPRGSGVLTTPRFFMDVEEKVLLDEEIEDYIETNPDLSGLDDIIITEFGRVAAEEERIAAEQGRVISEAERSSAEAERSSAEAERHNFHQSLIEAKNNGEFDGVSVTHSWTGTTLNVTSASGTSSVDLRGAKGDNAAVFIGTRAEYEAAYAARQIAKGTIVVIKDDDVSEDVTIAVLGKAILGKMILGKG